MITSQPSVWSTSTVRVPTTTRFNVQDISTVPVNVSQTSMLPKTSVDKSVFQHHKTKKPSVVVHPQVQSTLSSSSSSASSSAIPPSTTYLATSASSSSSSHSPTLANVTPLSNTKLHHIDGISSEADMTKYSSVTGEATSYTTQPSVLLNHNTDNYFCGPKTARNLFWNTTRVGEVNVQPCPGI